MSVVTFMVGQSYTVLSLESRATKEILSVKQNPLKKMDLPVCAGYATFLLLGNLSKLCDVFC